MADDGRYKGFICGDCGRFSSSNDYLERYCPECRASMEQRGLLYRRNEPRPGSHA